MESRSKLARAIPVATVAFWLVTQVPLGLWVVFHMAKFSGDMLEKWGAPFPDVLGVVSCLLAVPGIILGWLGALEFGGYSHLQIAAVVFGFPALNFAFCTIVFYIFARRRD